MRAADEPPLYIKGRKYTAGWWANCPKWTTHNNTAYVAGELSAIRRGFMR